MRNVILTAPTLSAVSGIATHVHQLMHSTLRQDLRVAHFCAGGEGLVESRAARLRRRAVTPIAWAVRLRRDGLPLVHINTALDRKAVARDALLLLIAKIMRCPVVWQVHGGCAPSEFCGGRATRKLLRGLLALADRVVVISRADAAAYRSFVVPARLCKISNAVDATEFDSIDRCIDVNRPLRIVFMGRLIAAKGVLDAVDAIAAVRAQDVPVVLKVAGTGPVAQDVARRVSLHGLQGQIQMVGSVAGRSKWDLLAQSDLFVLPTYARERMPYGLLEAMAAGVVPLVCAAGDIDELVIPEQHGFVLEPHRPDLLARAIVQLARDREYLAQLSQACKARVRELHGIQRMAGEFRRLYLNVCSS